MNRCQDTFSAAPSDDCAITMVVIGAQYASGSRNKRATSNETTAATAVRAECTNIIQPPQLAGPCLSPTIFFLHHPNTVASCTGLRLYPGPASVQKIKLPEQANDDFICFLFLFFSRFCP
jgi:hypothetical protein